MPKNLNPADNPVLPASITVPQPDDDVDALALEPVFQSLLDGVAAAHKLAQQGNESAALLLQKIKTVDGAGSQLDADLLDGKSSDQYWQKSDDLPIDNTKWLAFRTTGKDVTPAGQYDNLISFPISFNGSNQCEIISYNVDILANPTGKIYITTGDTNQSNRSYLTTGGTLQEPSPPIKIFKFPDRYSFVLGIENDGSTDANFRNTLVDFFCILKFS